jgi:hypothetical protein
MSAWRFGPSATRAKPLSDPQRRQQVITLSAQAINFGADAVNGSM